MMKKLSILLAVLMLVLVTGCANQGQGQTATTLDIAADDAAQSILGQVEFRDSLLKAEGDNITNYYILSDEIVEHAIYVSSSGGTAEEITVLKTADAKDIGVAKKLLEDRVSEQKARFEDYVPGEMTKLANPVIITKGNVAVLVVADDAANAKAAANEALK